MVDEVTSHNAEMMPVYIRFMDKYLNIREELLQDVSLPRITGLHIANKLKDVPGQLSLTNSDCRGAGQGTYMHSIGHCLNLGIATSCDFPAVRMDKMKSTVYFFLNSPKRESSHGGCREGRSSNGREEGAD